MNQRIINLNTSIEIASPVKKVWDIFTNTNEYSNWNPFIKYFQGKIDLNEIILEFVYISDYIYVPILMKIHSYEYLSRITWSGYVPDIFKSISFGEHSFQFEQVNSNKTIFYHYSNFSGIFMEFGQYHIATKVKKIHTDMNLALKNLAESEIN